METLQGRILGMIEAEITRRGYECAQSVAYANMGKVLIYRPTGNPYAEDGTVAYYNPEAAAGAILYSFQEDRYALVIKIGDRRIPSDSGAFDQRYDEPTQFWNALGEAFPRRPME